MHGWNPDHLLRYDWCSDHEISQRREMKANWIVDWMPRRGKQNFAIFPVGGQPKSQGNLKPE